MAEARDIDTQVNAQAPADAQGEIKLLKAAQVEKPKDFRDAMTTTPGPG